MEEKIKKMRKRQNHNSGYQFSDAQIEEEMDDQINEINKKQISQIQKEKQINEKYLQKKRKKREKQLRKQKQRMERTQISKPIKIKQNKQFDIQNHMDERQEGQINQIIHVQVEQQGVPSIKELGQLIKPITLTRTQLQDLLNSTRFDQLIKGCFVRYHCSSSNSYMIAEILGTVDAKRQYKVGKATTNLLIKLQLATNQIKNLSMEIVSNQQPPGSLEITKWFNRNRANIPKSQELIEKKRMLDKGLTTEVSTEEINGHIMKNIERVLKKSKEARQDVSNYLSFLNQRKHHIDVLIKQHEFQVDPQNQETKGKRGRQAQQERKKVVKIDINQLQRQKTEVESYIIKLKDIQKQQRQRRNQKKQIQKPKVQQIELQTTNRHDQIAYLIKNKIRMLSMSSQFRQAEMMILNDHNSHFLDIDI